MSSLILHPTVVARREKIAELRRELADLFDRWIHVSHEMLPALRHRYGELFGDLERKIQERTLDLTQRRRMSELFALKLDRGQKLDAQMVELVMKAVRNEFGRVRERVEGAVDRERRGTARPAPSYGRPVRDEIDSPRRRQAEVREIYRRLARRLHPDARGGGDELTRRYWDLVQGAHVRGDLELLRTMAYLVHEMRAHEGTSAEELATEERRLTEAIRAERARLTTLETTEPWTIREGLADEEWIAARRAAMESELEGIETEIAKCNRFLDPLFALVKDSAPPEQVRNLWESFVESMYFNNR